MGSIHCEFVMEEEEGMVVKEKEGTFGVEGNVEEEGKLWAFSM